MSINRFAVNSSHIYDITKVSELSDGLMYKEDKIKLDGLVNSSLGANVSVTVVSPSSEELTKEFNDIKQQLLTQRELYNTVEKFINSPGDPSGLATLDSTGKLPVSQLPAFKTVNNQSIIGDGNIEIRPGTDVDFTPVNTSIDNLSTYINENYARKSEISSFATTEYVDTAIASVDVTEQLSDYAKKTDIPEPYNDTTLRNDISSVYVPKTQLSDYALKTDVPAAYNDSALRQDVSALQAIDHSKFALKTELSAAYDDTALKTRLTKLESIDHSKYLTQHQSLADYATTQYVEDRFSETFVALTQAEYDVLTTKNPKTLYIITD